MRAVLSDLENIDSRNDMLTISVIRGTNSALHSFRIIIIFILSPISNVYKDTSSVDL